MTPTDAERIGYLEEIVAAKAELLTRLETRLRQLEGAARLDDVDGLRRRVEALERERTTP